MKNVIQPLAESVLIPLGLSTTASAAEAVIHKKNLMFWNSNTNNIKFLYERHDKNS